MQDRRNFVKQSGTLALGSLVVSQIAGLGELSKRRKMGMQLFTLFPGLDENVTAGLQKVADIGYKEIESAFSMKGGYYGMKPKEFKALLNKMDLHWRSHHVMGAPLKPNPNFDITKLPKMNTLKNEAQQIMDELAEGDLKYVVCANYPFDTLDEWKQGLEVLNKAGELAKKVGLTLAYHNHDKEFELLEGAKPYDLLLAQTDSELVKMELDLAWVSKAGVDPVALFEQHPRRFPLWHVKDMDKEFKELKPVGEGSIDFVRIFSAAKTAGLKHFFVEHDMPAKPYESLTSSFKYLRTILK